ncbi:nuclear transport factor 2 family protein [Rivularia sp. UHCC 0363]|uniref:nuclear transport factor 2 family protein n=1 Tax=Rivularia sp. UHCC 0363 TaxID=3110244 RepID=UPI002B1F5C5D|nr:nuclear transport factor 2 family protein [Rivularia sp. UHCC 0363]MEA5594835.1 nuclear transport factor 2 family protein [Rivularia sp. UHCC 0363]
MTEKDGPFNTKATMTRIARKFQEIEMMRYLGQVFISTGLIGLLAIPAMTQARTEEAGFQSNTAAFELSNDSTAFNKPPALDLFPALVNLAQATQPNRADAQKTQAIEQRNKEIVQQYFDRWQNGTGNFFDLLASEANWTITGTGTTAGTYRKQALIDQVIKPTSARLSTPIRPTVRGIWADGDMVIALWDGEAIAWDGRPYRNTYTWYFRMQDGKAVEVIAFLDMQVFNDLWTRVSPRS